MAFSSSKKNSFIILSIVIFCLLISAGFSYSKYIKNLDYKLMLYTECSSDEDVCTTDGEYFYTKHLAQTTDIKEFCSNDVEECAYILTTQNKISTLTCEEYLEEWEECTEQI